MESRIKERLTGALILVAALVILVPEIFSGRRAAESAKDAPAAAPAGEGPPLRSYTAELDAPTPSQVEQPRAEQPAVTPAPDPVAAPPPPPPPRAEPAAAPAPERAAALPPSADAPASGTWFVQVGSFSKPANAQRYAQQLRDLGHTVLVLPPGGGQTLSRVRVGPVRSREAAGALRAQLQAAGHKGAVVGP